MARNERAEAHTEPSNDEMLPTESSAPVADAAPAAVEENKADERFKFVTRPGTTDVVKRKDYILELWTGEVTSNNPEGKKFDRGAIARHLSEITGKKVPYQIVFAATKKVDGGPPKTADSIPSTASDASPADADASTI